MAIETPDLDPRDEDQVVADVIDDLPAELSDRNKSAIVVKLIEGVGAFYGKVTYYLNQVPDKLYLELLSLVGIEPDPASKATVTLTFTSADASGREIPAGTVVKTEAGSDAVKFETDSAVAAGAAGWSGNPATIDVAATAIEAGADGNVGAGTLETLESPIAGIDSVTNSAAASGGEDEETLDSLKARAPELLRAKDRAISKEDFERLAADVDGVTRAVATGSGGAVNVYILDTALNKTPASALQTSVEDELEAKTVPGVVVTAHQYAVRLIAFDSIEIAYTDSADQAATQTRIKEALSDYIDADTWEYGQKLYFHEVISLIDGVEGVDRVGEITYQTCDDFDFSGSSTQTLTHATPVDPGAGPAAYGLLHYDQDATNAPTITWVTL